jgi:hypothetical protein
MSLALRNAPAEAQRSRPVVGTGRLLICHPAGDNQGNTTEALRLQRLRLLGILGQRAAVIASLAWGETV